MRFIFRLSICLFMFLMAACETGGGGLGAKGGQTAEPPSIPPGYDDPILSSGSSCHGLCTQVPAATFTGPSLFWFGPPDQVPACPPETPHQGIQGHLQGQRPVRFVRECLVTPSDTCEEEGLVCIPTPGDGFHPCSHKAGLDRCVDDHLVLFLMQELETNDLVTLCCGEISTSL